MQGEEVIRVGKLNLVDLAGSENVAKSGASGGRVYLSSFYHSFSYSFSLSLSLFRELKACRSGRASGGRVHCLVSLYLPLSIFFFFLSQ